MYENARHTTVPARVELNEEVIGRFLRDIFQGEVAETADDIGLPYSLVYNLVHGRIHSISARDYRIIFGEEPPPQAIERVDGRTFRVMVRLWLFLNGDETKAGLYRLLYPDKHRKKVDYRIFTGEVNTVEKRLERLMEKKFQDQGLERADIKEWIDSLDRIEDEERIPYEKIRPVLAYLEDNLGVNPSRLLDQSSLRYESGELKTVSRRIYDRVMEIRRRAGEALESGSKFQQQEIREAIYGKREGMTLYARVERELKLLERYEGKSSKAYLGRSMGYYEKGALKRIPTWRAERIHKDFLDLIENRPDLPLRSLPRPHLVRRLKPLFSALSAVFCRKMVGDKEHVYERSILAPSGDRKGASGAGQYDLVPLEAAPYFLGMTKKAFDLMLSRNVDIFRSLVVRSGGKWYLPGPYLEGLAERDGFSVVKCAYERM